MVRLLKVFNKKTIIIFLKKKKNRYTKTWRQSWLGIMANPLAQSFNEKNCDSKLFIVQENYLKISVSSNVLKTGPDADSAYSVVDWSDRMPTRTLSSLFFSKNKHDLNFIGL